MEFLCATSVNPLRSQITLIPKHVNNITRKENHRPVSLMSTEVKYLNKTLAK